MTNRNEREDVRNRQQNGGRDNDNRQPGQQQQAGHKGQQGGQHEADRKRQQGQEDRRPTQR